MLRIFVIDMWKSQIQLAKNLQKPKNQCQASSLPSFQFQLVPEFDLFLGHKPEKQLQLTLLWNRPDLAENFVLSKSRTWEVIEVKEADYPETFWKRTEIAALEILNIYAHTKA